MKFCTKCGNQLSDEALFCTHCGTKFAAAVQPAVQPVTAVRPEPEVEKEKKSKKEKKPVRKGKVIAILCLVLLLVGAAVGGYFALQWYNSGEQQLLRALKAGRYEQVLDIVDEDSSLKHSDELAEQLQKRLETLKTDFTAQAVEYAAVQMELDTIAEIGIKKLASAVSDVRNYVEKLNASRTAFATAESFFASASYVEAIAQYKLVIREDSNYETAQTKANEAATLYRRKVLADAGAYADTEDYEAALTLLKAALDNLPGDAQITQQIQLYEKDLAQKLIREALDEAEKYANTEDYASAIAVLEQYISANGENVDVKLALNDYEGLYAAQLLANALQKAEDYAIDGNYLSAMKTLRTYVNDYGTNASVAAALKGYTESYVDTVLASAEEKANANDYPGAITALQTGLSNAPGNERLTVRLNAYTDVYVADVIAASDALVEQEDYDGAQKLVDAARKLLPDHATLKAQSSKIAKERPKNFVDELEPYQSSGYTEKPKGVTFSMAGEERTNGIWWQDGGYAYFNLQGKYSLLLFDVGHVDGSRMEHGYLKIYVDGVLILELDPIDPSAFPKHYELDISGVQQLKIEFYSCYWGGYSTYATADMLIK